MSLIYSDADIQLEQWGRMEKDFVTVEGEKYYVKDDILDLGGLEITDTTDIEGLDNLTKLRDLRLCGNQIREIKGLEHLNNLENLEFARNMIEEIEGLEQLANLKFLDLSFNRIKEIKGLGNLKNLIFLNLNYNVFLCAVSDPDKLEQLTNLMIYLFGTPLRGGIPETTVKEKWQYFIHSAKDIAALARGDITLEEIGG